MTDELLLEAKGLRKSYLRGPEEVHALDGVSLVLRPGEIAGLVGPSGSGKTTLLNLLVGWEAPDDGELLWAGEARDPAALAWQSLAIVPQSLGLIDEFTVGENVLLPARLSAAPAIEIDPRLESLLDALGLSELRHRSPDEISLGEQQRTAIARALLLGPSLLLADEPTAHQDAASTKAVMGVFQSARSTGTSVLLATHNHEILRYMDRVLGIRDGRLGMLPEEDRAPLEHGAG